MMLPREFKCVFAYTAAKDNPAGLPGLTFLMPEAAWHYMESGMCHEFDLTKVGIPIQVIIGRCRDHAAGIDMLRQSGVLNDKTTDLTTTTIDMHIGTKETVQ